MSVRIPLGGLAALSTLLLAACGGGGGGSESSTPPVQTATALAVSASNYTTVAQQSVSSSLYLLDSAESVLGAQSAGLNAPLRYALAQTERLAAWFAQAPRSVAGQAAAPMQNDLFASLPHPVIEELQRISPDDLTPRQALELLYAWKTRI